MSKNCAGCFDYLGKMAKYYLNNLQPESKWMFKKDNFKVWLTVLVKKVFLHMCKWALSQIDETYRGSDAKVRVIKVCMRSGEFKMSNNKNSCFSNW